MSINLTSPVFLLGMPRSGTTWLSQIFESAPQCVVRLSPPYAYDFRGMLTVASDQADWIALLGQAVNSSDPFMTQNWRRDTGELQAFEKDPAALETLAVKDTRFHALYQAGMSVLPEAKLIYIVRHPAAALWSWRNCKEFPADADFAKEWRHGACRKGDGPGEYWGFEDWKRLTSYYLEKAKAAPARYKVVSYEALVADALTTTKGMFDFAGLSLQDPSRDFIAQSQSQSDPRPYSVFKTPDQSRAWQTSFPADVLAEIEAALHGTPLAEYLA